MKTQLLLLLMLLSTISYSQDTDYPPRVRQYDPAPASRERTESTCSPFYLGISGGLNNNNGLFGVNIDVPVFSSGSLGGGAGLGTWGWKVFGEFRLYFSECHRGWALGSGLTYSTGVPDIPVSLNTMNGVQEVTLDFHGIPNVFFSGYRFFNVGRKGHRFHLQTGLSFRTTSDHFRVKSNHILTEDSRAVLKFMAPGGLILAGGFSFAL